ncbi:MAG TPA: ferritin-like domain-containing protein [Verrucomicrobiae bacterium]|jgi:ferritin-like metal-binding protein YciE
MNTLEDLFWDALADMYYAEEQQIESLQKMAKAATHDDLRSAFESHLVETEEHVHKVKQIFELSGRRAKAKPCLAMLGIIDETEDLISDNKQSPTINAALVYAAEKAEYYEIASYGGLHEWAKLLGHDDAARLIGEILAEEKLVDNKLNKLALEHCNPTAKTESIKIAA